MALLLSLSACVVAMRTARIAQEASVPVHDPRTSSWVSAGRAPADEVMVLTAVLEIAPEKMEALEATFWAVSDPKDERYGKHLTKSELRTLLDMPTERVARVSDFFMTHGAHSAVASDFKDTVTVTAPVAAIERALQTNIGAFTHRQRANVRILRAQTSYSLPVELDSDLKMVGELLQFPRVRSSALVTESPLQAEVGHGGDWPNACNDSGCDGLVTPAVLGKRYEFDPMDMSRLQGSMAVAEFQGQYFRPEDNAKFNSACHAEVNVSRVVGGNKDIPGVEAELDIQYIKGVAPGIDLTVIYASSYSLLNWATKLMGLTSPPLINSVRAPGLVSAVHTTLHPVVPLGRRHSLRRMPLGVALCMLALCCCALHMLHMLRAARCGKSERPFGT